MKNKYFVYRISKDDKSICCGLASIGNQNFTVIAEQKGRNTKELFNWKTSI